jgi:hypothetical protein
MSDITIAASAKAFTVLFNAARDHFHFSKSDSTDFGPFTASYAVSAHLQDGSVTLNDNNTIEITDLEIVWDTLTVQLCLDISLSIPSFCIVPDPWNGCLVGFPGISVSENICVPLDFSGLVSEITDLQAGLSFSYYIDPARLPGWSDLDAELNGHPNMWRIFINPVHVLVDPIDIPATAENLLKNAIKAAIEDLIPGSLPDIVKDVLQPLVDVAVAVALEALGIVGDVADWLSDLLGNLFDLLGAIETAVAAYFASQYPIQLFEDPFPIMQAEGGLIPVKIPIRDLTATVNSKEMIVVADVGA